MRDPMSLISLFARLQLFIAFYMHPSAIHPSIIHRSIMQCTEKNTLSNGTVVQHFSVPLITVGGKCSWQLMPSEVCSTDGVVFIRLKSGNCCDSGFARLLYDMLNDSSISKSTFRTSMSTGLQTLKSMRNDKFNQESKAIVHAHLPSSLRKHAADTGVRGLSKAKKDSICASKTMELDIHVNGCSKSFLVFKPDHMAADLWVQYSPEIFKAVIDFVLDNRFDHQLQRDWARQTLPKGIYRYTDAKGNERFRVSLSKEAIESVLEDCGVKRSTLSFPSLDEATAAMHDPISSVKAMNPKKRKSASGRAVSKDDTGGENADDDDEDGADCIDEADAVQVNEGGEALVADEEAMYMMG